MAKSCYEYAIWVIGKYPKTEKELRIKMYQQGYDSETVMRTLEKLKKDNFVNDELFAESYINSEVIRKWRPLIVISQKLEVRGIEKDIVYEILKKLLNLEKNSFAFCFSYINRLHITQFNAFVVFPTCLAQ